jgi:hypothetical protein
MVRSEVVLVAYKRVIRLTTYRDVRLFAIARLYTNQTR